MPPLPGKRPAIRRLASPAALTAALILFVIALAPAFAASLYQDGAGSRAKAMGGTGTASADDPASALFDNPAALSDLDRPMAQSSVEGALAEGVFHDRANARTTMSAGGAIGEFAASLPLGAWRLAIGVNPDIGARTDWRYRDALGGADGQTSYGVRDNQSELALLRSALGASWQVTRDLSLGVNAGLLYNKNVLETPYVFQRQPVLRGVKTLLDLQTDGFGGNGQFGLRWRPMPRLALSLSYTTEARVDSHGTASGNADVQLAHLGLGAARPNFKYQAEVDNVFPRQLSAGAAWTPRERLTLSAQFDWIDWADAFGTLPIFLTHGTDPDLNGLVGSNRLNDTAPLHWRDQYVGRLGIEQNLAQHWSFRAGYAYGNNPVPPGTLTPLTAAITEHTVTAGVGYRFGRVRIDGAYQWQVPATGRVRQSDLLDGEYSNSRTEVNIQWFSLSAAVSF